MRPHAETGALILGGTQGPGLAIAEALVARGCTRLVPVARAPARGAAAAGPGRGGHAWLGDPLRPESLGRVAGTRKAP